jgi:F-type H+-transporting ATPase subunit delta
LDLDRRTAKVEAAVPLSPELQSGVAANLNRIYGAGLNISFVHNPSLIGGLRIKVGSDVYDGSVQSRLAALQEKF